MVVFSWVCLLGRSVSLVTARRQDLTPAAVAQQVRVLEKALGTALLARAGRTVAPTELDIDWHSTPEGPGAIRTCCSPASPSSATIVNWLAARRPTGTFAGLGSRRASGSN